MMTKMISTVILISTMIALALADSLAPRISSSMQRNTRTTASRLITPPSSGELDTTERIWKPNTLFSNWLTYCDHPTATAALDTPYSRSRQAAMTIATTSPRVA